MLSVYTCKLPSYAQAATEERVQKTARSHDATLLRNKNCVSHIDEFTNGSTFHRVLYENGENKDLKSIERVVICSGKVFYDLAEERDKKLKGIRLLRLEQLYVSSKSA